MDLTKITSSYKEFQNPQTLRFVYGGPKITFWGIYSNTTYRVNEDEVIAVDERDVDYLLSLERRGKRYFELAGVDLGNTENEKTVVSVYNAEDKEDAIATFDFAEQHRRKTNYDEDFSDTLDPPYDYFDGIDGIGEKLNLKIHELGVHDFFDLHAKGVEWITSLPRISEEKANKIYKQLEVLIGEY